MSHRSAAINLDAIADGPLILAVDLGTSGCKCALVALDGTVQAWTFEPVSLHINGLAAEQVPADWWNAFLLTAGQLCQDSALRQRIVAVCCSTQNEGTVCVDKTGNAIGRAMLWLDMRGAEAIARRTRGRLFNIEGYAPLKLLRWLRRTGGAPSLSGKDCAGHIAYLQDQEPARYEATHKFLNVLDYMNLRLTGRFCTPYDTILTAWITDNRNPRNVRYDDSLISMLGIDRDKLPELVSSTEVLGPLLPEIAQVLGLNQRVVVVAGASDTSAVAVGAAVADYASHLYLGTSSWVGAHVPFMKTDIFSKIASVISAVDGRYLALAMQSTAGANLSFLRDRILFHQDELLTDEERPDVYDVLNRIAQRVPAGAKGLIYMPWLFGERTPVDNSSIRAGLLNLSLEHSREDIIRAFMEGVALNTRWMIEPFERLIGCSAGVITAVGGGAQSNLWCQIIADITNRPVGQPANPIQANAVGTAFLAAIGIGELGFADLPALQRLHRIYEPTPALRNLYDERYSIYKDLYRKLAPIYQRMNPPEQGKSHARP